MYVNVFATSLVKSSNIDLCYLTICLCKPGILAV